VGVKLSAQRLAAGGIATALLALVICDLTIRGFRLWWDSHSVTSSVVSNLLVLGVAALIVDEVIARRQRNARATSVAVQAIIVYDQASRAFDSALAGFDDPDQSSADSPEELRTLAGMLLTSSPSLFDDPEARLFLESVQRLAGTIVRAFSSSPVVRTSRPSRDSLIAEMSQVRVSAAPLIARLSAEYRAGIDEPPPGLPT
jgi:hypothetical protein